MRAGLLGVGTCAALVAGGVYAEEVEVGQKDKTFSQAEVSLSSGDAIVFVNDDSVAHNVFSRSPGFQFNLKLQKPGEKAKVVFDQAGEFTVRCAIHPRMELVVKVTE